MGVDKNAARDLANPMLDTRVMSLVVVRRCCVALATRRPQALYILEAWFVGCPAHAATESLGQLWEYRPVPSRLTSARLHMRSKRRRRSTARARVVGHLLCRRPAPQRFGVPGGQLSKGCHDGDLPCAHGHEVNESADWMDAWWRHAVEAAYEAASGERGKQRLGRGHKDLGKAWCGEAFKKVVLDHCLMQPGRKLRRTACYGSAWKRLPTESGPHNACVR